PAAAASTRKRPTRTPGLTASNAGYLIAEGIRKKFSGADGWKTHVPLQYLTDKYCSFANHASTKELNDLFTVDNSAGALVSMPKELAFEPELSLTFDEWFQAWGRLLELIETYVPEEHAMWVTHFESILHRPNRAHNWALCLEYDSQIRRRVCTSSIDPSIFHLDVWNELEAEHIGKRAIATVRRELQGKSVGGRSDSDHGTRFQPYENSKQSFSNSNHSFRASGKLRCFVCGDDDPTHRSRSCKADRLVNGKELILVVGKPGAPRRDRSGQAYCFSFNGFAGCTRGNNCTSGKHWCSLCGTKNSIHSAQNCTTL
ncbi:hypothetical protein B0H11DRAFT_1720127, partial [Mycena galericulata]